MWSDAWILDDPWPRPLCSTCYKPWPSRTRVPGTHDVRPLGLTKGRPLDLAVAATLNPQPTEGPTAAVGQARPPISRGLTAKGELARSQSDMTPRIERAIRVREGLGSEDERQRDGQRSPESGPQPVAGKLTVQEMLRHSHDSGGGRMIAPDPPTQIAVPGTICSRTHDSVARGTISSIRCNLAHEICTNCRPHAEISLEWSRAGSLQSRTLWPVHPCS